ISIILSSVIVISVSVQGLATRTFPKIGDGRQRHARPRAALRQGLRARPPTPTAGTLPQSGERDVSGGITKAGEVNLRRALCQAATVMMHRGRATWLRTWAAHVARRRGAKRAMVALARRIGVILHRMWVDGTDFRPDIPLASVA
ncbi:transposase, partial [Paracoccus sp. Z118]|uniref:transposase n=1 Tax=Paracoccus sp. Z118 TaxID=2851017 RepID=UPI0020B83655